MSELEAIARRFSGGLDIAVEVAAPPLPGAVGMATFRDGRRLITLSPALTGDALMLALFHEIAHHALDHVAVRGGLLYADALALADALAGTPAGAIVAGAIAALDRYEEEAEAFAVAAWRRWREAGAKLAAQESR